MLNQWDARDAARCADDLALRVYSSRLLGGNPALVLHGGGNTSVKVTERDIFGDPVDLLYVKGSGWDLGTIERPGFAPVRMDHLLRLAKLDTLSDLQMATELRRATVDPAAPAPSVEAILHAILPFRFVDHTHADALIALMNTPDGERHVRALYGDRVVVIPYIMPGFALAKLCAARYPEQAGPQTVGMVLMNHGLFTWGASAQEAYESHIALVTEAEEYLAARGAWQIVVPELPAHDAELRIPIAELRQAISRAAGFPLLLRAQGDALRRSFAQRPDVGRIARQGPATPDHIIRTKQLPMVGRDVAGYVEEYRRYFEAHRGGQALAMVDPAPRIVIDPELGVLAAGRTLKDALIAEEIYQHTIEIILRAEANGGYRALPSQDLFDVEYWDLEQAKLKKAGAPPPLAGQVALVTGAASGIGRACVESLRRRGAAVIALDISPALTSVFRQPEVLTVVGDVCDPQLVESALEAGARAFGGLDMLVLNAGIFGASRPIAGLPDAEWGQIMRINLDANLSMMRAAHPLLRLAPQGGRVVVIGSKNVPAPGPGAAAYSASKAALTQLARVAALEWGGDGIRVNVLHPNAVFDTGIWTDEVLATRAASYGLTVEQYKTNNLLRVEIGSRDVGELAAELCGPLFAKTTGAQIPVDGGNDRVI
jgi:rhamnose utilization protein RhaD (predicted bifunctional aldolase and dehydrogenase)/NAD(P)-dependent dehydrogenase (short-subunit alcohol dehydrogenase family)